jgi:hypothetical protein
MFYFGLHWSEQVRVAPAIVLTDEQERELNRLARSRRTRVRLGVRFGDVGMIAFVPAAAMYLAAMVAGRAACRARLAWQLDRAIDLEAWRISPTKSTQH